MGPLLFLLATQTTPQAASSSVDPNEIPYLSLESGADSPVRKKGIFVYHTAEAFHKYLDSIDEVALKKSNIDWDKDEIIVIQFQGVDQNGTSIKVKRVHREKPGKVMIDAAVLKAITGNIEFSPNVAQKTTFPFAIIQTPKMTDKLDVHVVSG